MEIFNDISAVNVILKSSSFLDKYNDWQIQLSRQMQNYILQYKSFFFKKEQDFFCVNLKVCKCFWKPRLYGLVGMIHSACVRITTFVDMSYIDIYYIYYVCTYLSAFGSYICLLGKYERAGEIVAKEPIIAEPPLFKKWWELLVSSSNKSHLMAPRQNS